MNALGRQAMLGVLSSLVVGLSGCNGCSGCEGQTIEPVAMPPVENPTSIASVAPSVASVAPAPSAVVQESPSAVPNSEHDPTGVSRCCTTIRDNLDSAPDKHKATWKSALAACNEAVEKKTGRKGLEPVREILTPVGWPAACH
ncbi:MAG TPA: hypothetical protein PK156_14715 [Polyangium sp.]|nr:hypothetical protein [Polyangium sp.]